MSRRQITVRDRGTTIVLTGCKVAEIARHAGLKPIYNGVAHGWVSDADRLPDFLAFCQSRHIEVSVVGAAA